MDDRWNLGCLLGLHIWIERIYIFPEREYHIRECNFCGRRDLRIDEEQDNKIIKFLGWIFIRHIPKGERV